jgi:hypothetical protein
MRVKTKHFYEFDGFRIDLGDRLLLRDSEVIALAPKAFDLLLTLVENNGHVLSKDELMKQVWQDTFVEEANLNFQITTLRKALGEEGAEWSRRFPGMAIGSRRTLTRSAARSQRSRSKFRRGNVGRSRGWSHPRRQRLRSS